MKTRLLKNSPIREEPPEGPTIALLLDQALERKVKEALGDVMESKFNSIVTERIEKFLSHERITELLIDRIMEIVMTDAILMRLRALYDNPFHKEKRKPSGRKKTVSKKTVSKKGRK